MTKDTMIIYLDYAADHVGVLFDDPADDRPDHPGQHEGCMFKADFFRWYLPEDENILSISYEPGTPLYHITFSDGEVVAYDSPQDHPALAALDALAELILDDELIIKNQLYGWLSTREDGGWLHCLEELALDAGLPGRFKKLSEVPDEFWTHPKFKKILERYNITIDMKNLI